MALRVARFKFQNLIKATTAVLSTSSSAPGTPVSNLLQQVRSLLWRSLPGWTIIVGWNDRIDFNRGGVKVITITPGYYATGAALAAVIQALLQAADGTPTWTVAYNPTTKVFTISTAAHSFTLPFLNGANALVGRSAHLDLGYTSTDKSSAANAVIAEGASYQSRHYVAVDLSSAQAFTASDALNHGAGTGGTFTLKGSATSVLTALTAPSVTKSLPGDADIRNAFWASESYRYVVLEINATADSRGYTELGLWFLGGYTQLVRPYSNTFQEIYEEFSSVSLSDTGVPFHDEKPRRRLFKMNFNMLSEADRASLKAVAAACPMGKCFLLSFDATTVPTDTAYVYFAAGLSQDFRGPVSWNIPVELAEALG